MREKFYRFKRVRTSNLNRTLTLTFLSKNLGFGNFGNSAVRRFMAVSARRQSRQPPMPGVTMKGLGGSGDRGGNIVNWQ